jgi:transcriptional regulator with XRE-family HTH domain
VIDNEGTFDFKAFYRALDASRASRQLNWKQVAEETSVSASTLARMAQSRRPDADGLASLAAWSGLNPGDFVRYRASSRTDSLAEISRVLSSDPRLLKEDAEALEDIVRAAYLRMQQKASDKDPS